MSEDQSKHSSDDIRIDTSGMSDGKKAALELTEEAREKDWLYSSFAADIFMGKLSWNQIHPFPAQSEEDREQGKDFLEKLKNCLSRVDADEIDRSGEVPQEVLDELAKIGAFGIKIKKDYGGLGLSQLNYIRAAIMAGSHCGSITTMLSAHQSIGVPQPLIMFGSEEQKRKYLPRVAGGEISAFALTETEVGSDPAKMNTIAEPSEDGQSFTINGEKLWCTNGTKAKIIVVMASTPAKMVRGKARNQISAFIVDCDTPGLSVTHRCEFMGLKGIYNAVIKFEDVVVPKENIILGEGKGLKVALATLNTGRLTVASTCIGVAKLFISELRTWVNERVQWGSPIGEHSAIAEKIAHMAATSFAMEAMVHLTGSMADHGKKDIRIESAFCKMFCTEASWKLIDDGLQVRGGRGYETAESQKKRGEKPFAIERFLRDARINTIFEGSSEIMRLLIAREALDPHFKAAGDAIDTRLPMSKRIKGAMKALKFYAWWYPKQWFPIGKNLEGSHPSLRVHIHFCSLTSQKLARRLFHAMLRFGPRLEQEQILLARFVDIAARLFAMSASCSRAQQLSQSDPEKNNALELADYFCREATLEIKNLFSGVSHNNDETGYKLAQKVMKGNFSWFEKGTVQK